MYCDQLKEEPFNTAGSWYTGMFTSRSAEDRLVLNNISAQAIEKQVTDGSSHLPVDPEVCETLLPIQIAARYVAYIVEKSSENPNSFLVQLPTPIKRRQVMSMIFVTARLDTTAHRNTLTRTLFPAALDVSWRRQYCFNSPRHRGAALALADKVLDVSLSDPHAAADGSEVVDPPMERPAKRVKTGPGGSTNESDAQTADMTETHVEQHDEPQTLEADGVDSIGSTPDRHIKVEESQQVRSTLLLQESNRRERDPSIEALYIEQTRNDNTTEDQDETPSPPPEDFARYSFAWQRDETAEKQSREIDELQRTIRNLEVQREEGRVGHTDEVDGLQGTIRNLEAQREDDQTRYGDELDGLQRRIRDMEAQQEEDRTGYSAEIEISRAKIEQLEAKNQRWERMEEAFRVHYRRQRKDSEKAVETLNSEIGVPSEENGRLRANM